MPRRRATSNEARAKVLLELAKAPKGLVLTKLNQKLNWKKTDTKRVLDDLEVSAMAFADDTSHWSFARQEKVGRIEVAPLFEISPKGTKFLSHWMELERLRSKKGRYSKYRLIIEGPMAKYNTWTNDEENS